MQHHKQHPPAHSRRIARRATERMQARIIRPAVKPNGDPRHMTQAEARAIVAAEQEANRAE